MFKRLPIVVWSLEGAILRRDAMPDLLEGALADWMGRGRESAMRVASGGPRAQTDNEVVRALLQASGVSAQDWMIRGALAHHERCLEKYLLRFPALATPGVDRAMHMVTRMGAPQMVLSWHTEAAVASMLRSSRLHIHFEIARGQDGAGRLRGIFSADRGDMYAILMALRRYADGWPLVIVTGNPREIFAGQRIGAVCIGVTSPFASPAELSTAGARLVISERTGVEKLHEMLGLDRLRENAFASVSV